MTYKIDRVQVIIKHKYIVGLVSGFGANYEAI